MRVQLTEDLSVQVSGIAIFMLLPLGRMLAPRDPTYCRLLGCEPSKCQDTKTRTPFGFIGHEHVFL
jgi:hypothetical protein